MKMDIFFVSHFRPKFQLDKYQTLFEQTFASLCATEYQTIIYTLIKSATWNTNFSNKWQSTFACVAEIFSSCMQITYDLLIQIDETETFWTYSTSGPMFVQFPTF